MIDLIGDVVIDPPKMSHKTNNLLFVQGQNITRGNFGSDSWFIPLSEKTGIKIIHSRRYPKRIQGFLGTKWESKAEADVIWFKKNWIEFCQQAVHTLPYLPEIYDHIVIRHTGAYEFGMTKKRQKGYDKNVYYPGWLMPIYKTDVVITEAEREHFIASIKRDKLDYREAGLKAGAGWGRDSTGHLVMLDIDEEGKAKVA